MDGFGTRSYEKLWDAIQASRNVSFDKFLVSLGIPNVGKTASKAIAKYCEYDIARFEDLIGNDFDWTTLRFQSLRLQLSKVIHSKTKLLLQLAHYITSPEMVLLKS